MIEKLTFENLPQAIQKLDRKLELIHNLLLTDKDEEKGDSDELLTVSEAAKFLSLTDSTIYTKVSRNELPFMKRGKRLYFSKKDLVDWLKGGRIKTKEEIYAESNLDFNNQKRVES